MNIFKKLILKWCYKIIDKLDYSYSEFENMKCSIYSKDVYWCQIQVNNGDLVKVTPGHRIRPYVVERVEENGIIALSSSSKPFSHVLQEKQLFVSRQKYNLNKNSYIDTTKQIFVPWDAIKEYYYTLDDTDFNQIQLKRKLKISRNDKYKELGIGSLIRIENTLYLIYGIKDTDFIVYKLYSQKEKVNKDYRLPISYNSRIYFILMKEQNYLNQKENYTIVFQYDINTMKSIKAKIKIAKDEEVNKEIVDRNISFIYTPGCIFTYAVEDEFMYLFNRKNSMYGVFLEDEILCLKKVNEDYLRVEKQGDNELLREILEYLPVNHNDEYAIQKIRNEYLKDNDLL